MATILYSGQQIEVWELARMWGYRGPQDPQAITQWAYENYPPGFTDPSNSAVIKQILTAVGGVYQSTSFAGGSSPVFQAVEAAIQDTRVALSAKPVVTNPTYDAQASGGHMAASGDARRSSPILGYLIAGVVLAWLMMG